MTTTLEHIPTHKEHAKETTTKKEREITLGTEKAEHNPDHQEKINETMAPTTLTHTKKPRARWILIKMRDDRLIKTTSTHFDKWSVIKTTDTTYPQIVGDIQAYEVFERQEPAFNRREKATPHSIKTSTRDKNRKIAKTTSKENDTKTSHKDSDTKDPNPKDLTTDTSPQATHTSALRNGNDDIGNGNSDKTKNHPRLYNDTKVTATQGSEGALVRAVRTSLGEATEKQQEAEIITSKITHTKKTSTIQLEEQLFHEEMTRTKRASLREISAIETTRQDNGNTGGNDNPIAQDKDGSHLHKIPSTLNEEEIMVAVIGGSGLVVHRHGAGKIPGVRGMYRQKGK